MRWIVVCGIFGFSMMRPVSMDRVFRILKKLEVHRLPQESMPLGGYGVGVAILLDDGTVLVEKVGKIAESPAELLPRMVKLKEASVLLGHVRMPSPEFMNTAKFRETAQPYAIKRNPELTVASVHNGKMENYRETRSKLGAGHVFESEKHELVDSEVIPHFFEEMLSEREDTSQVLYECFCALKGSNTAAILQVGEEDSFIHLVHKGKTRGLTVWSNKKDELFFCSRKTPLIEEFGTILTKGDFREKVFIGYHEEAGLVLSRRLLVK
jgi:glucosamine 6-phosphate synthetase-like amidotransferase/phosphosugar isomerase protein